jgi:glycosyltransferase involved in cell wall biosynthesis
MRINFILPFYSVRPIGGLKVVYEYANQLAARGHDVSVIHPRSMRNIEPVRRSLHKLQNAALDTRNRFAPRAGLKWQPLDPRVRIVIVPEPTAEHISDAEAVFATAWQTAAYVREYPARKGNKFYLVMDFDPWIASQEVLEETWEWPFLKITISNWLYEKVRAAGCAEPEVVNIPIGVSFDQFHLTNDIDNRAKSILMLYSSSPSKGSEVGLEAIAKSREAHPDLEVTLFGPTMRRRPAVLPDWARYGGNITNERLRTLYNGSRVYVCSSFAEGFALPPAEAMACGCAVAATDCGGIREFAVDGVNALLSAPGDVDALARNITSLLDDNQLRVRLATAGHQSISGFTWETAAGKLEELISNGNSDSRTLAISQAAHG